MEKGFPEYISNRFCGQIFRAASDYLTQRNIRRLPMQIHSVHAESADYSDLSEHSDTVRIPLCLAADVTVEEEGVPYRRTVHLAGEYSSRIADCFTKCEITVTGTVQQHFACRRQRFDSFFLPQFSAEEAEEQAMQLLRLAYSYLDVHWRPQQIDPMRIAQALHICVRYGTLTESGSLPGRYVFADADVPLYDSTRKRMVPFRIPGRTLLLERRMCGRKEMLRTAAARLLVRAYFYRLAYAFFAASRKNMHSFRETEAAQTIRQSAVQTDRLAAAVLMPKYALMQKMQEYSAACGSVPDAESLRIAVRQTADFFGVTEQSCAARLKAVGALPEAYQSSSAEARD